MFKDLLKRLASELAGRRIPYMVIGGQAVLLYGEPRLTKDIDIMLGIGIEEYPVIISIVRSLGLKEGIENIEPFVRETMVLPANEPTTGIRVDFIFSSSPYERQAISRAREVMFDDVPVRFASLEDVVIHKVVAGRARDIEDIRIILRKNPAYDGEYIRAWLIDFDHVVDTACLRTFEEIVSELARE